MCGMSRKTLKLIIKHLDNRGLDILSRDTDFLVRTIVARCCEDNETIERLSNDTNNTVRCGVVENRNISSNVLKKMATDKSRFVKYRIARHHKIDAEIIGTLLEFSKKAEKHHIVRNLYKNKNVPQVQKDMVYMLTGIENKWSEVKNDKKRKKGIEKGKKKGSRKAG